MKLRSIISWTAAVLASSGMARADVFLDIEKLGDGLGGWKYRKGLAAEYQVSGSRYRTFRPAVTRTPDGGMFVSIRIDNERGFLAADDHASLEMTFKPDGQVFSARSSLSLQGKKVTSDLIVSGLQVGKAAASVTPADAVVKMGADLVANLTEKLSRESSVEPGRVTFPSVVQHNFNLLYQAVSQVTNQVAQGEAGQPAPAAPEPEPEGGEGAAGEDAKPEGDPPPQPVELQIEVKPPGQAQPPKPQD